MKNERIEIRITSEEKEKLTDYAKKHNTTIAKLTREYWQKIIKN